MKIAICSNVLAENQACGTRTLLVELIREWRKLERPAVQVTVVVNGPEAVADLLPFGQPTSLRLVSHAFPKHRSRLTWLMGGGSIRPRVGEQDVFLSGWHWPLGRRDVPFVGILHDLTPLDFAGYAAPAQRLIAQLLFRLSVSACLRRSAAMVVVSRFTQRRLKEVFGEPRVPLKVIPHGIDAAWWGESLDSGRASEVLAGMGLNPGASYVLAAGQHVANKNHWTLLQAFARAIAPCDPAALLVVAGGHGPETARLLACAREQGLGDRLCLPGFVSREALRVLMTGARAFAFPSYMEGFGIPVLEAFAAGTAVVCSNTGALAEVAGDAAVTVDPADAEGLGKALAMFWFDTEARKRARDRGMRIAAQRSWGRVAGEYLDLFRWVRNPAGAPPVVGMGYSGRSAQARS